MLLYEEIRIRSTIKLINATQYKDKLRKKCVDYQWSWIKE